MKLLGIVSVGFDLMNYWSNPFRSFDTKWKYIGSQHKMEVQWAVHRLSTDLKKAYDSVSVEGEVFCDIVVEFWVSMKLVRLIKTCWNETEVKSLEVTFACYDFYSEWSKTIDALLPFVFKFA
jgi:hypothetical protein